MGERPKRARWRVSKQGTRFECYQLRLGEELLAVAQETSTRGQFYWYVMSGNVAPKNTASTPTALGAAKLDAATWCRKNRKVPNA